MVECGSTFSSCRPSPAASTQEYEDEQQQQLTASTLLLLRNDDGKWEQFGRRLHEMTSESVLGTSHHQHHSRTPPHALSTVPFGMTSPQPTRPSLHTAGCAPSMAPTCHVGHPPVHQITTAPSDEARCATSLAPPSLHLHLPPAPLATRPSPISPRLAHIPQHRHCFALPVALPLRTRLQAAPFT
ncbi:hypothetical protein BDZ97DRAFT_1917499 [Flammula alnicola]|nr:hypothetical protein BDZ97DRAFT_1917499 [Flammula alnicola]